MASTNRPSWAPVGWVRTVHDTFPLANEADAAPDKLLRMGWYEASGVTMRPHWSTGRTKYLWARVADDGTLWVRMDHIFWSDDPPRYERSSLWTTFHDFRTNFPRFPRDFRYQFYSTARGWVLNQGCGVRVPPRDDDEPGFNSGMWTSCEDDKLWDTAEIISPSYPTFEWSEEGTIASWVREFRQ